MGEGPETPKTEAQIRAEIVAYYQAQADAEERARAEELFQRGAPVLYLMPLREVERRYEEEERIEAEAVQNVSGDGQHLVEEIQAETPTPEPLAEPSTEPPAEPVQPEAVQLPRQTTGIGQFNANRYLANPVGLRLRLAEGHYNLSRLFANYVQRSAAPTITDVTEATEDHDDEL